MSVIDDVRREREDLARVLKKHTGIRRIVEDLYPESAHFIYELLQNAEDTGAVEAQFTLAETGLVFEHNGRPFEEKDIYAITDIGEGNKAKDDDKIGRFGVGFKAVFAYSESPLIWSPGFSFKITDLVLPTELGSNSALGKKTRFEFPFNNPKKIASAAYNEIDSGLKELAETTLLFLSHLESIRWSNATGESGEVLRFRHSEHQVEVLKQTGGKTTTSFHFLKFDQPVVGLEKQRVAVAYPLELLPNVHMFESKKPLLKQVKIISAIPGRVAVFFPAEKEKSGLRFHLHAPFVPELSRASIKKTDANLPLFQQLANLVAASLHEIRDLGLLTTDFLSVLPNPLDAIDESYLGIREAIVKEMNEQWLTPTYTKSHAPANHLLQAKASLKELLSKDDIEFLIDNDEQPPQWASARALQGTNIERFMAGLAITDWDIDEFVELLHEKTNIQRRITSREPLRISAGPDEKFMTWLSGKPADWHQELYALLESEYLSGTGRSKVFNLHKFMGSQIVRLRNDDYSVGTKCYFPSDGVEQDDSLPRVDARTYSTGKKKGQQESAKKFLEEIGVREVGEAEQVEAILKERYAETNYQPLKKDFKRFIELVENSPDKASLFAPYWIFERCDDKCGQPSQVFLDLPFLDTGLGAYYDIFGADAERFALAQGYEDCGVGIKRIVKFAEAVGVQTRLEITETNCAANPQKTYLYSVAGTRSTSPVDEDFSIVGLDKFLAKPSVARSKLIWRTMHSLPPGQDYLHATFQRNWSSGAHRVDSYLIHRLRAIAWIPQGNQIFVRPAEAIRELLPEGFPFDQGWLWLKAIQFGEAVAKKTAADRDKQNVAKYLGFESADRAAEWAELDKYGISPGELLAKYRKRELPDRVSPNPERRITKIVDEVESTPAKMRETRPRTVDPDYGGAQGDARAYLKHQYTNDDVMFCQLCQLPQPVMLNGEPHFEAVDCIGGINSHHEQNNLALCPNHSAMFRNGGLTPDVLRRAILECERQRIPLNLAGNDVELYFTQQHLGDLHAVLQSLPSTSGS